MGGYGHNRATDSIVTSISDETINKMHFIKRLMAGPTRESEGHVYIKQC